MESNLNVSVGNPGDEGLGVRVRFSTSNNSELQEALSIGSIEP
jgi:hypothetical protein